MASSAVAAGAVGAVGAVGAACAVGAAGPVGESVLAGTMVELLSSWVVDGCTVVLSLCFLSFLCCFLSNFL